MQQLQTIKLSFKCPMAFNELVLCNGGFYCHGCEKIVHDFRGKSEAEIKAAFAASDYKLCGMFEADRIQISTPFPKWRKWMAAAMLTLGFSSLHQILMAQQLSKADSAALTVKAKTTDLNSNEVFGSVENGAEFPGGIEKFQKFLAANIKPNASCLPGQKAYITFTVGVDGRLSDFKFMRSPFDNEMNERIIEVFKKGPLWKPGSRLGEFVKQQFTCPVMPVANDTK